MNFFLLFIESIIISTLLFLYLNYKAKVELKYLFIDNIFVAAFATIASSLFYYSYFDNLFYALVLNVVMVPTVLVLGVLIRFYRVPYRKTKATTDDIVSPADGNVLYIKRVEAKDIPIAIKNGEISKLSELTNTDILDLSLIHI